MSETALYRNGERVPNWLAMMAISSLGVIAFALAAYALTGVGELRVKQGATDANQAQIFKSLDKLEHALERIGDAVGAKKQ